MLGEADISKDTYANKIKDEYLIEEMKAARLRIDENIRTMNQFEILSLVAIGLIYWFILANRDLTNISVSIASFFPVMISAYGLFRYRAHARVLEIHKEYIKNIIEKKFLGNDKGLVEYYDVNKNKILKIARYVFWFIIFLFAFSIFIISSVCPHALIDRGDVLSELVVLEGEQK